MTRKKKRSLLRKVKIAVVAASALYLIMGVTSLGQSGEMVIDTEGAETEITVTQPCETPTVTAGVETCETEETGYQSLIYSYDWSGDEAYLLAKIAMAEAENQDTEGKALVMLVVLNRVWGDNGFPGTIEEVIFQPGQFSPVSNGRFDRVEPDADCYAALELIESGWDESYGALYFESKSNSTWHEDNLKFLFKHQDHYFYTEE